MKIVTKKIGDIAELTGYIHTPNRETPHIEAYPAILILPGGGFRFCSFNESEPVATAYFAEGFQAFTLKYTTVTDKPDAEISDPIRDVQEAMEWIRAQSADYYVAKEKLALLGFSGGAHLAAAVSTRKGVRPDLLLLGYPGILHSDLRALECPDIVESVDETTPSSFIFCTRDDKITPPAHALAFAQALDAHGIDFELHIFRQGDHGLSLAKPLTSAGEKQRVNKEFSAWFPMSINWLWALFGEFPVSKHGVNCNFCTNKKQ